MQGWEKNFDYCYCDGPDCGQTPCREIASSYCGTCNETHKEYDKFYNHNFVVRQEEAGY